MPAPHHQMFVCAIQHGRLLLVWLQEIAPSEFTWFDSHEESNLSGRFVQAVLFPSLWHTNCYIKDQKGTERTPKTAISCKLTADMHLIQKKGKKPRCSSRYSYVRICLHVCWCWVCCLSSATLGIKGLAILCVVLGLFASAESAQDANNTEGELTFLKLKLKSLKDRFRHMCNQYSDLAHNCSAPGTKCSADEW